jgi:hypothetical protein
MIELRNHARIVVALPPLLLALACSPRPEPEVETVQSGLLYNSTLSLTLLSVIRGDTGGTLPPDRVSLALPTFKLPPGTSAGGSGSPSPSAVFLGNCNGPTGGTQTCSGLTLPRGAWTKDFSIETTQPRTTTTYAGEIYILPQGLGAPLFARCFHLGFNTATLRMTSVPSTRSGCDGQGPDDSHDPVTCDATTCTATINITANGGDRIPWKVKFGYQVKPPMNTQTVLITPTYMITNVYYSPPGKTSTMEYKTTTSVGTTLSSSTSFKDSVTVTTDVGTGKDIASDGSLGVSLSESNTWGTTQSDETDIVVEQTNGYTPTGQVDGIDHTRDEIWLLLRPQLTGTFNSPLDPLGQSSLSWSVVANQDGAVNAAPVRIYVGELTGVMPWDQGVLQELTAHGVTPSDYANILSADPMASGSLANPSQDQNRFVLLKSMPFSAAPQGDLPAKQVFTLSQKTTNSSTMGSSYSYSTGVTVTGSGDSSLLTAKYSQAETWTWEDSSSVKLSNGTTVADTLTVSQPAFGYQGPIFLRAYEDTIFKTYAFGLDSSCLPGTTAQVCNMSDGSQLCTWTQWGFEPGAPGFWSNSAETSSTFTNAQVHSGTQSLLVSASSDPTLPARINTNQCFAGGDGTMDLRGKTYSAWIMVATSSSSYAGTSCTLRAFDHAFHESGISTSAVRTPITPGSWFQLSGVFPSTSVEAQIYELTVECKLPTDWTFGDSTKVWYVDDIQVL